MRGDLSLGVRLWRWKGLASVLRNLLRRPFCVLIRRVLGSKATVSLRRPFELKALEEKGL